MDFTTWLQTRLKELGYYTAKIDGDWGGLSVAALEQFQRAYGLKVTSVSDRATVDALKVATVGDKPVAEAPTEAMPPWMAEMYRRMGMHEVRNNASLIEFLKIGKYLGNPKDLPWCGDGVESCILKVLPKEPVPSNPFFAQNWKNFGIDVGRPIVGAVGVIKWTPTSGHVGFIAGVSGNSVEMLGANQNNEINITRFSMGTPSRGFIAFRWPRSFPFKSYPAL